MENRFMSTNGAWLAIDGDLRQALQQARERLDGANEELVLDFKAVRRIEPDGLEAMEILAGVADAKGIRIALTGVSIGVYKVLKLTRLAARFSFVG
jgi:anti-anti-sigma regulatory factor